MRTLNLTCGVLVASIALPLSTWGQEADGALHSPREFERAEVRREMDRILNEGGELGEKAKLVRAGRREKGEQRIVNGTITFDYPAAGALLKGADRQTAGPWCSGTLIACDKFLTAAHCISAEPQPNQYRVFFQNAGFFEVKDIRWPKKDYKFPYADLAVLTLSRPVEGITPVAINNKAPFGLNLTGLIVGFGRTGGPNQDFGIKRQGSVTTAACQETYANKKLLCWNFTADLKATPQNTCNADSGGGLFVWEGDGARKTAQVVGLTSGGVKADCLKGDHSFDTDVFAYHEWIVEPKAAPASCGSAIGLGARNIDHHVKGETTLLNDAEPLASYKLDVPAGLAALRVAMNGEDDGKGNNDFDLYVIRGTSTETEKAVCTEDGRGQFGFCEVTNPEAGPWTAVVRRKKGTGLAQVTITEVPKADQQ